MVTRTQAERAARLITRLGAELARRQDLLAEGGFAGITEQRAAAPPQDRLPHIIVLLDRWEGFTTTLGETGGGALTDVITRILAEGASAGVHLVMTGDRSLLAGRIAAMCEDKLVFKLAEKDDYALAGLRPRDLPDDIGPGRAFRAGTGTETQVALLAPDPSGQGQAAALRQIAGWAAGRDAGVPRSRRPFRVDLLPVPDHLRRRVAAAPGRPGRPPAVGAGRRRRRRADRTRAGPVRRHSRLHRGRPGPVGALGRPGLDDPVVPGRRSPGDPGDAAPLAAAVAGVAARRRAVVRAVRTSARMSSPRRSTSLAAPGAVVIDDADLLTDCEASGELSKIITRGAGRSLALVLAGDSDTLASGFGGWQADARRARRGCLTAPQILPEGELIGARLTHAHLAGGEQGPVRSGRALLNTGDGNLITVTVPGSGRLGSEESYGGLVASRPGSSACFRDGPGGQLLILLPGLRGPDADENETGDSA